MFPAKGFQVFPIYFIGALLFIFRVFNIIVFQGLIEAIKIKGSIVCNYCLIMDKVFDLVPNMRKRKGIPGMSSGKSMDFTVPVEVKIIGWVNQFVHRFFYDPVLYPHHANLANAPPFALGSFKINGRKSIIHKFMIEVLVVSKVTFIFIYANMFEFR